MKAVCVIGMSGSALKQSKHVITAVTDTLIELGLEVSNFNIIECGLPYFEEGAIAENFEKMASFMAGVRNIILAFNVTDYGPCAPMKVFLEHAANSGLFENKNIFILAVDKSAGEKEAADYVSRVVSRYGGVEIVRVAIGGSALRAVNSGAIPLAAVEKYAEDYYRLIKQNRIFFRQGEYIGQAPPYISKEAPVLPNQLSAEIQGLKSHVDGKQGIIGGPITDQITQKSKGQDILANDGAFAAAEEIAEKKESILDFDIFNARQEEDIEELTKLFATKLKGDEQGEEVRNDFSDWKAAPPYGPTGAGRDENAPSNKSAGVIPSFAEYKAGATYKDNYRGGYTEPLREDYGQRAPYEQGEYMPANDVYKQGYGNVQNPKTQAYGGGEAQRPQGYPPGAHGVNQWEQSFQNDDSRHDYRQEQQRYVEPQRTPQRYAEPQGPPRAQQSEMPQGYDNRPQYNYPAGANGGGAYNYGGMAENEPREFAQTDGRPKDANMPYNAPGYSEPRQLWQNVPQSAPLFRETEPARGALHKEAAKAMRKEPAKEREIITARVKTCKQMTQNLVHYFQPQIAQDTEAVFQFNITGEEQFSGYLVIKNRDNEYFEGQHESADITILADSAVWVNVLKGRQTAQKSFMTGQLKVRGNFMLLNRFDQMYKKM